MPSENELDLCPKCGNAPRLSISRQGRGRQSYSVYGHICSNCECSWSYACTVYRDREEARKMWNAKARWYKQLEKWSQRLDPCSCGGKAKLVYECYSGSGYGFWFVRCEKCHRLLSAAKSMEAIIESWNRRMRDAE